MLSVFSNLNLQQFPVAEFAADVTEDLPVDYADTDIDSDSFCADALAAAALINDWHFENAVQSA